MARHAINRNILRRVARNTKAHRVIHGPLRRRLFGHVAVASGAIDARTNMRRVIELHMRLGLKSVHAHPRDVLTLGLEIRHFLDFWFVGGDGDVARHAEIRAGNVRIRPAIDARVAEDALQTIRQMHLVRELNRLNGSGTNAEKFPHGCRGAAVCRGKDACVFHGRGSGRLRGQWTLDHDPHEQSDTGKHTHNARPQLDRTNLQRESTPLRKKLAYERNILHSGICAVNEKSSFVWRNFALQFAR
jgi:hypothetical protein